MLRKVLFLVLLLTLFVFVGNVMAQDNEHYIKVTPDAKLSEFVDKKVKLKGKTPTAVAQHPILTAPAGLGKKEFQSYLDTKFGQIILISGQEIKCPGKIKVFGKLEKVALGGKKDTKESYEGFLIRVDRFKCK